MILREARMEDCPALVAFMVAWLKRAEIGAVAGNALARRLYQASGLGPYHVTSAKRL